MTGRKLAERDVPYGGYESEGFLNKGLVLVVFVFFFFQAEDGIRDRDG